MESHEVTELAMQGYTYHQIAERTGLSVYKVFQMGRAHGTRRRKVITDRQRNKLIRLVATKQSLRSIAEQVGCSKDTVRRTRMLEAATLEGCARSWRCPSCGAKVNTYKCVLCSIKGDAK